MVSPKYIMISKINDTLEPRFKAVLSLLIVGETISSGSLFDKHRAKLLQRYKDEKNAKVEIAHAIKRACDLGILKRCDDTFIPEWFERLRTVSYWQSQLRGNRLKNQKEITRASTKDMSTFFV